MTGVAQRIKNASGRIWRAIVASRGRQDGSGRISWHVPGLGQSYSSKLTPRLEPLLTAREGSRIGDFTIADRSALSRPTSGRARWTRVSAIVEQQG